MHELPADWGALCTIVLLLGLRHAFDADHLAAIDGWSEGKAVWFGAIILAVVALGYLAAPVSARRLGGLDQTD